MYICIYVIYFSVAFLCAWRREGFISLEQLRLLKNSTIRVKKALFFDKYTAVKMNPEHVVTVEHITARLKKIL